MQLSSPAPVAIVLGAAGFVGRHACRTLAARGCFVVGMGHGRWSSEEWRDWGLGQWIESDITLEALQSLELPGTPVCVLHCAGSGAVSYSYASPWDDFQRAAVTTAAVLEWIRLQPNARPRFVLVSSAAVYGDRGDADANESSSRAPISPYGFHKMSAETLCESASRFFGAPVSIVRLFSVYGEGLRKQLLWDAMNKFARGEHQFFGTGHELRDWIHVDDAAALLCAAALSPQALFEIYNGAHMKATTAEVLERLSELYVAGAAPAFNGQTHTGNPRRLTADCGHTRRLLAWEPTVTLDEGLRRYVAWFRNLHSPQ